MVEKAAPDLSEEVEDDNEEGMRGKLCGERATMAREDRRGDSGRREAARRLLTADIMKLEDEAVD